MWMRMWMYMVDEPRHAQHADGHPRDNRRSHLPGAYLAHPASGGRGHMYLSAEDIARLEGTRKVHFLQPDAIRID
jgi:hypothetical protein